MVRRVSDLSQEKNGWEMGGKQNLKEMLLRSMRAKECRECTEDITFCSNGARWRLC